ncbi:hypothetical protein GDO81_001359 [Engystomops pustulosus]|uniref:Uncharacterized protein n=1 Tax=Engystomops pustulosus TaxID=76066 RepID=A0AAV7DBP4_ENGPU|nr:hypothetical protein GDO81_001359 [Engystomops pustulosus]
MKNKIYDFRRFRVLEYFPILQHVPVGRQDGLIPCNWGCKEECDLQHAVSSINLRSPCTCLISHKLESCRLSNKHLEV